ncbi:MAG: DUF512 domain-containing protein [Candidatus Zixiibacteriota bacterium]|nr:MAG: DUF512 domain-containing protein [candidate division Zixibacteria bacterium]
MKVNPNSPLYGHVRRGHRLVGINGEPVADSLDYQFKMAEDVVRLEIEDSAGASRIFRFRADPLLDLGLTFEDDRVFRCDNNCLFCFVHQQPKGMRRSLYIKDDDYRLSFTHGNFISLSNLAERDLARIIHQRLSPLYVSIHATDETLRRCIFQNEKLPPVLPLLERLIAGGIAFHTQVVVCPGVNDGEQLDRTINDLFALYPGVRTLGVVPVGLTRYRRRLPEIASYDPAASRRILSFLHGKQKKCRESHGTRFVFASDEFYLMAGRNLPKLHEYEDMAQFENGIGMLRWTITQFNRRRRYLKGLAAKRRIIMLTGKAAYNILNTHVVEYLREETNVAVHLVGIENSFWGSTVTVSGLLTGQDLLKALRNIYKEFDLAIIPPNCLNNDRLFLDDMSLQQFRRLARMDVRVGSYQIADTVREVLS